MKKLIGLLLAYCTALNTYAAQNEWMVIDSKVVEQQFKVKVLLPDSYQQTEQQLEGEAVKHYPVLYTRSSDRRLALLRAQMSWLSHVQFAPFFESIIVVLPEVTANGEMDKFAKASGSADRLAIEVYQKDVIPYIDQHFRTQPFRMIEGFSTAANQILSIFLQQPSLFNVYMAFSPALALDNSGIVKRFEQLELSTDYQYRALYLNLGSFDENSEPFEQLQMLFNQRLKDKLPGLVTYAEDLSQHNYLSGPVIGLVDAGEKLFADRFPAIEQFEQTGTNGVNRYFAQLKQKYGFEIDSQNTHIDLAYFYVSLKRFADAQNVMTALLKNEPQSIFLHTRLADVQKQSGNNTQAKETLKRGLNLAKQAENTEAVTYIKARIKELK
ncbi:alpha/beta hydrolase-fold protein [Neptunicella sp. SCSIO 80796]|uniref:alpha/beta hydrolase-fold protein n=1 Tax=Neptunicella plasticusilytica TaxID=3117012 RepID=UPI003A4D8342